MGETKKGSPKRKSSSGSDPKSKAIVRRKMETVMHEFKEGELDSGNSGQKVRNPKQAIAIGLSEARRAGAKIPPSPNQGKRGGAKKTGTKKALAKRAPAKKIAGAKKSASRKR